MLRNGEKKAVKVIIALYVENLNVVRNRLSLGAGLEIMQDILTLIRVKPPDVLVVSEPCHLFFGIVARVLFYLFYSEGQLPLAVEVTKQFLVSDRVQRVLMAA